NFVMFNLQKGLFKDKNLREALAYALDRQNFVDIAGGSAEPIQQFVSSGIFGFNPNIKGFSYDMTKAKSTANLIVSHSFEQLKATLDYAQGNDVIAQYIQNQLRELGINLK